MILTTLAGVPGRNVRESLGVVEGSCVQSKHIGHDIFAGLKTIVGGEIASYTELMSEARKKAIGRLEGAATAMGADAVVNIRFASANIMAGASEILVYGTAVKLE